MKYIDSEELIDEIKRRMKDYNASIEKYYNKQKSIKAERDSWKWAECKWFLNLINSLQQEQPSLPSNLDEAAEKYSENILANNEDLQDAIEDAFKAGAEWYDNQMKMPNSSELISAWHGVKSILQEKDFRGDEWRLAYNAFMFGFSRGINTQKTEK